MVEPVSDKINASAGYREYLVIGFYVQLQLGFKVASDISQQVVELFLVRRQDDQVIGIPEIVLD